MQIRKDIQMDWTGNTKTAFVTIGASNHSEDEREYNDYYATDPKAMEMLCDLEDFDFFIWEPSCGEGHLSKVLNDRGYMVRSTDLIDRGYGEGGVDFLQETEIFNGDIITNPPYKYAKEFVEHALSLIPEGNKVAMFLKLTFLESQARRQMFEKYPPKTIYVSSKRIQCAKNGDFDGLKSKANTAIAYAWFIWEKGFAGEPVVRWFN